MEGSGEQVETIGNQGRQSDWRHMRKSKRAETRGELILQNKTGNDKTRQTKNQMTSPCDRFTLIFYPIGHMTWKLLR